MQRWNVWYRIEPKCNDRFKSYTRFGDAINFMRKLANGDKQVLVNQIDGDGFIWENRITGEQFEISDVNWEDLPNWLKGNCKETH